MTEDITSLIGLTLESEMAWNNMEITMMKRESYCLLNENKKGAKRTKEDYYKNILRIFEEIKRKFKALVNEIIIKLQRRFLDGKRYLRKHGEALSNVNLKEMEDKEVDVYDWKLKNIRDITLLLTNDLKGIKNIILEAGKNGKAYTSNELCEVLFSNRLRIRQANEIPIIFTNRARSKNKVTKEITMDMINNAKNDIKDFKNALATVKALAALNNDTIELGKKNAMFCLEILHREDNPDFEQQKRAIINTSKTATSIINRTLNILIKLLLEKFTDSMRILNKVVSNSNK